MLLREDLLKAIEPISKIQHGDTPARLAAVVHAALTACAHRLADSLDPLIPMPVPRETGVEAQDEVDKVLGFTDGDQHVESSSGSIGGRLGKLLKRGKANDQPG